MPNRYRHVGITPCVLASGRPVAPGDTVSPNTDDPDDRALIDAGTLAELPAAPRKRNTSASTADGEAKS